MFFIYIVLAGILIILGLLLRYKYNLEREKARLTAYKKKLKTNPTRIQHSQPKTYMFDFWILILGLKCKIIRTPANKNINKTLRQ